MRREKVYLALVISMGLLSVAHAECPYNKDCLNNPYGAGNPYSKEKLYVVPSE